MTSSERKLNQRLDALDTIIQRQGETIGALNKTLDQISKGMHPQYAGLSGIDQMIKALEALKILYANQARKS